ncbi:hypothetical protein E2C01_061495 [Portunus trituberculatus]|uniref:Uncharacterized protein n=1 Tax=Portunus trituberculatus TaxID=210409 RepID=A0A5B7H412_PORTR|nr:hypothetical protein [Portunus trituberculatus]
MMKSKNKNKLIKVEINREEKSKQLYSSYFTIGGCREHNTPAYFKNGSLTFSCKDRVRAAVVQWITLTLRSEGSPSTRVQILATVQLRTFPATDSLGALGMIERPGGDWLVGGSNPVILSTTFLRRQGAASLRILHWISHVSTVPGHSEARDAECRVLCRVEVKTVVSTGYLRRPAVHRDGFLILVLYGGGCRGAGPALVDSQVLA